MHSRSWSSRLRQLDVPPSQFALRIPDSVEVVFGTTGRHRGQGRVLEFGRGSCLKELYLMKRLGFCGSCVRQKPENAVFMRIAEAVLKRFRSDFEAL
jgi:hypothetical protein